MSTRRELLDGLRIWREAGVLDAAEVHIASSLAARAGESRPHVVLALALAVAAPRSGHVALDPAHVRESAMREAERVDDVSRDEVAGLPWPVDTSAWLNDVGDSPLTPEILRVEHVDAPEHLFNKTGLGRRHAAQSHFLILKYTTVPSVEAAVTTNATR